MDNLNFTAIDFETATNHRHSVCQIGICRVENGLTVFSKSFLIQPPKNEYSSWNIRIHGIIPEKTKDQPLFSELWDEIRIHFDHQLIVAHNVHFDIDCLYKTLEYYNLDLPTLKSECTFKISGLNLIDLAESLEIPLLAHHDALNDSILCAESYIKLMKGHKPDLRKITPKVSKKKFAGFEKISGNILKPDLDNADTSSPFYNKKVVFTGILNSISREQAAEIIKRMGADIDSGISKKTDFVIVGAGAGPSKLKKIKEYNDSGSNIKLIYEAEFQELIKK